MKKVSEKLLQDIEIAERQVSNDDELNLISGGTRCAGLWNIDSCTHTDNDSWDDWCPVDYCCYTVFFHPEETTFDDSCMSNYSCVFLATPPSNNY